LAPSFHRFLLMTAVSRWKLWKTWDILIFFVFRIRYTFSMGIQKQFTSKFSVFSLRCGFVSADRRTTAGCSCHTVATAADCCWCKGRSGAADCCWCKGRSGAADCCWCKGRSGAADCYWCQGRSGAADCYWCQGRSAAARWGCCCVSANGEEGTVLCLASSCTSSSVTDVIIVDHVHAASLHIDPVFTFMD
jgi:hypothetical protein